MWGQRAQANMEVEGVATLITVPFSYCRSRFVYSFFLIYLFFIYLFLALLSLRCCTWAFSSCGDQGLLFIVVCGLLTAVASLVAEHGL